MSEYHTPGVHVFDDAQITALEAIGSDALTIVEQRFGSGYPEYQGGEAGGLAYHNRHHSAAVQQDTARMCYALGMGPADQAIGRAAAAAHDIVQLKPRGVMEQESAEWLEAEMRRRGIFPEPAIAAGALAILGTEPTFDGNRLTGQVVSQLEFPSNAAELVAKSVACADLGEIYTPQGPLLGHELYKEINGVAPDVQPSLEKLANFQRGQVALAESYRYPHPVGEKVFGRLRQQVVAYGTTVLKQLERGELTSWDDLIAQDMAFMQAHS